MCLAAVIISGRDWLAPAAGGLALAIGLLVWAYSAAPISPGRRWLCGFLKLLGFLALLACLIDPLWTGERARPGANAFLLVADNSLSMALKDRGQARSRGELLRELLSGGKAGWQSSLEGDFQVRRYFFDSRLQATADYTELTFDGRRSSLLSSLQSIKDRQHGKPVAGILVFTDGNATDFGTTLPDLAGLPPIYPVVIGSDGPMRDVALQRATISLTAFEDAPVTVQAEVSTSGYAGQMIVARLTQIGPPSGGVVPAPSNTTLTARSGVEATQSSTSATPGRLAEQIVAEQRQRSPGDAQPMVFRFPVKTAQTGLVYYRVQVAAAADADGSSPLATAQEATGLNNSQVLIADRGRGPYRVLYVAGRPNWEYKFLQRAVSADDQIQLVGLIRMAHREPKLTFRGRAGESSNPLYRGFGGQGQEEIERYDQPVLTRLNTRDEFELRGGFPKLAEELYGYQAVIVDDLESGFFTPDQALLLQKFVSERGGGFLMLGGTESFQQGQFDRTAIGDMLPVYLDQVSEFKAMGELHLSLTREGWVQPWVRLRNNEAEEKQRLAQMAPFGVVNPVRGFKPGASVLATVTAGSGAGAALPALVAQRFGHGRVGALLIGDLWHWGFRDEASHRDLSKAWRQMLRWLVTDTPSRVELQVDDQPGDPDQAVRLRVRARDRKFQPLENASASVEVHEVDGATTNRIRLTAGPAPDEPGVYEAVYVPRRAGAYEAAAVVVDAAGAEEARVRAGWASDPGADEFKSLKPNRALLETLAQRTGGEVIAADALPAFAKTLPNRRVPVTETTSSALWHQAGVFCFALLCFVAEWGVRRARGLV